MLTLQKIKNKNRKPFSFLGIWILRWRVREYRFVLGFQSPDKVIYWRSEKEEMGRIANNLRGTFQGLSHRIWLHETGFKVSRLFLFLGSCHVTLKYSVPENVCDGTVVMGSELPCCSAGKAPSSGQTCPLWDSQEHSQTRMKTSTRQECWSQLACSHMTPW